MSNRAIIAAYDAYPLNESNRLNHEYNAERMGFGMGYEQAEKDIWGRIEKYLSEQTPGNYATAGFILKNFEYFKQQIMEEE